MASTMQSTSLAILAATFVCLACNQVQNVVCSDLSNDLISDLQISTYNALTAPREVTLSKNATKPRANKKTPAETDTGRATGSSADKLSEFITLEDGTPIMLSPPTNPPASKPTEDNMFVTREGNHLMLRGQPWYFVGFNAYWFIDAASWGHDHGRKQVAETFLAAKKLGLRVARTWGFNSKMPSGPGSYDEDQFLALDFVVYCAKLFDVKLILALGNFWDAYKGPEDFLWYAMGAAGQGILDFYSKTQVKELFKNHIKTITGRINRFTGVAYKDDPTIMGYDVMNEPRCPGCESDDLQDLVIGWLNEMTTYTKGVAPKQLAALGTEGFFMRDDRRCLHLTNPGPGAQCEGEHWWRIAELPAVGFSTMHVYERHMEKMPLPPIGRSFVKDPDWFTCNFGCYINWIVRYMQAHMEAAVELTGDKPVVLEEFGLTWWKEDVRDRRVLMAVLYRLLQQNAASGGNLAGVMVWNGAHNEFPSDQDGYNIVIDKDHRKVSEPPQLHSLPPIMPYLERWCALDRYEQDGVPRPEDKEQTKFVKPSVNDDTKEDADGVEGGTGPATPGDTATLTQVDSGRKLLQFLSSGGGGGAAAAGGPPKSPPSLAPELKLSQVAPAMASVPKRNMLSTPSHTPSLILPGGNGTIMATPDMTTQRSLLWQAEKLDGFRRGWDRGSCAHESSRDWRPPQAFVNSTKFGESSSASDLSADTVTWMAVRDLQLWRDYAWPLQEVDIMGWAAAQVNKPGQV